MINHKEIKRLLRLSPLANSRIYHLFRFYMKRGNMDAVLKKVQLSPEEERQMRAYMKESMVKYRWDFDECIFYHYATLSENERKTFVPEYEKNIFCDEVNDHIKAQIFDSKWKSYCCFKEFYKRDCVRVDDRLSLNKFLDKHRDFIIKPDSSACGRGIKVLRTQNTNEALQMIDTYINTLPDKGGGDC